MISPISLNWPCSGACCRLNSSTTGTGPERPRATKLRLVPDQLRRSTTTTYCGAPAPSAEFPQPFIHSAIWGSIVPNPPADTSRYHARWAATWQALSESSTRAESRAVPGVTTTRLPPRRRVRSGDHWLRRLGRGHRRRWQGRSRVLRRTHMIGRPSLPTAANSAGAGALRCHPRPQLFHALGRASSSTRDRESAASSPPLARRLRTHAAPEPPRELPITRSHRLT